MPASLEDLINEETPQSTPEGGAWESTPVKRTDVIRESDATSDTDLPSSGVTKDRKSHYHTLASNSSKSTTEHKPSGISQKV
mgnify:FL=1